MKSVYLIGVKCCTLCPNVEQYVHNLCCLETHAETFTNQNPCPRRHPHAS